MTTSMETKAPQCSACQRADATVLAARKENGRIMFVARVCAACAPAGWTLTPIAAP